VNLDELDRVLDGARQEPLSDADYDKLKGALHTLAAMLVQPRNTEKTSVVLEQEGSEPAPELSQIQPHHRPATDATQQRPLAGRSRST